MNTIQYCNSYIQLFYKFCDYVKPYNERGNIKYVCDIESQTYLIYKKEIESQTYIIDTEYIEIENCDNQLKNMNDLCVNIYELQEKV